MNLKFTAFAFSFLAFSSMANADVTNNCESFFISDQSVVGAHDYRADLQLYWGEKFPEDGLFESARGSEASMYVKRNDKNASEIKSLKVEVLKDLLFEKYEAKNDWSKYQVEVSTKKLKVTSDQYQIGTEVFEGDIMRGSKSAIVTVICTKRIFPDLRW